MSRPRDDSQSTTPGQSSSIELSSVFRLRDLDHFERVFAGDEHGYFYARDGHPNGRRLASILAEREGADAALIFPSGMAAITALAFHLLKPGEKLIADAQIYGKSALLFDSHLRSWGVDVSIHDLAGSSQYSDVIRGPTRMVFAESLTNPLIRWRAIDKLASAAHASHAVLVIDSTFSPPPILRPLDLGADFVIHSLTKVISGHSDVTLGVVLGRENAIDDLAKTASTFGYHAPAFDCWLTERSLMSVDLRVRRSCESASRLASHLSRHPRVNRVHHPSLPNHPDHAWAAKHAPLGSHMLAFELDSREAVNRFFAALERIPFCPSLGDAATTVSHPASTSHRVLSQEERGAAGIAEGLVRMSVGLEDVSELIKDIDHALVS